LRVRARRKSGSAGLTKYSELLEGFILCREFWALKELLMGKGALDYKERKINYKQDG